ncbi:phosphatidylinositol transfer protein csr1 [Clarireedia jacksonii]
MNKSIGRVANNLVLRRIYTLSLPSSLRYHNGNHGTFVGRSSTRQPSAPYYRKYSVDHSRIPRFEGSYESQKRTIIVSNSALKRSNTLNISCARSLSSLAQERLKKYNTYLFSREIYLHIPKQSSLGSWTTVLLLAFLSGAFLYTSSKRGPPKQTAPEHLPADPEQEYLEYYKMAGETLPGRPGTLTPQEEEKLKEFWVTTLQLFGIIDKEATGNGEAETPNGGATTEKKTKKKRGFSVLRSKHKGGDAASIKSSDSSPASHISADADDKYGQTKEFHEALASLSPESIRTAFWSMVKYDHPDALLLRFLRARKWDVDKALVMMISTMRWRALDMHVDDDIIKNGELAALEDEKSTDANKKKLGEGFLAQMRTGKSFLHGHDKAGRPMCFVRARLHKQGEQSEESLERYTVFIIESARMFLEPPVDTACIVFDLTGFSLANMDYAPVKFMIKCFEANYPESLGVVLVHRAPWVFQGIWKIIRGWLDPVVASKVHFTNNVDEMSEFVPRSHILKELGGDEDWSYTYVEPVPGENDTMKDVATRDKLLAEREKLVEEWEKATLEWIEGKGDSQGVKERRTQLAGKLREDYWRLDPYVRARTLFDRTGVIKQGGKIDFYPEQKEEEAATTTANATSADDVD